MIKKLLSLLMVCVVYGLSIHAQDCPICGDYSGFDKFENKLIIRVKSNGDNTYHVREKTITSTVTRYDDFIGYTIRVNTFSNGSTVIYGEKCTSIGVYDCFKMEIKGNRMVYSYWAESDKGGRIGEPFVYTLYKDEDDW